MTGSTAVFAPGACADGRCPWRRARRRSRRGAHSSGVMTVDDAPVTRSAGAPCRRPRLIARQAAGRSTRGLRRQRAAQRAARRRGAAGALRRRTARGAPSRWRAWRCPPTPRAGAPPPARSTPPSSATSRERPRAELGRARPEIHHPVAVDLAEPGEGPGGERVERELGRRSRLEPRRAGQDLRSDGERDDDARAPARHVRIARHEHGRRPAPPRLAERAAHERGHPARRDPHDDVAGARPPPHLRARRRPRRPRRPPRSGRRRRGPRR